MCSFAASLLYGITVNAHDLIRGARAFAKFTKNAVLLDLLLARKKRPITGTPVSCSSRHCRLASPNSLCTLPAELLLLIREHLREAYVKDEPSYWANELHWKFFTGYDDDQAEELRRDWSTFWSEDQWEEHEEHIGCDLCADARYGLTIYHDLLDDACLATTQPCTCERSAVTNIRQVLTHYGLILPSTEFFDVDEAFDMRELAWVVALPSARENASGNTACATVNMGSANSYHDSPYEKPPLQTATFIDPSYFQTTEQDDRNFRRLVHDLELRIVDVGGGTAKRWTKKEVERREREAEEKGKKERRAAAEGTGEGVAGEGDGKEMGGGLVEVRPRWMLVQTSVSSV